MSLPILNPRSEPTTSDLVRLFHKTENLWAEHIAEAESLDVGTAFCNPQLREVWDANNIRDVALPENFSPAEAFAQVQSHYQAKNTSCIYWTFNPSVPKDKTQPLIDHLLAQNFQAGSNDIMLLEKFQPPDLPDLAGIKIIPARASFRHTRQLMEESAARWKTPQVAEAAMLHLDDPHWDALLALQAGLPVAHIGVLAVGEIGRIDNVYVAESHRRLGLGSLMLSRILETCARALFKHVLLSVLPTNLAAINLYSKFGFKKIASTTSYFQPSINLRPGE